MDREDHLDWPLILRVPDPEVPTSHTWRERGQSHDRRLGNWISPDGRPRPNAICFGVCAGSRADRASGTKREWSQSGLDSRSMHPSTRRLAGTTMRFQCELNPIFPSLSLSLSLARPLLCLRCRHWLGSICLLHFRAQISNHDVESKQPTRILSASLSPATHGPQSRLFDCFSSDAPPMIAATRPDPGQRSQSDVVVAPGRLFYLLHCSHREAD